MSYRIKIDHWSWTTDDLTLDESCDIEEEIGTTWHTLEPINSARHARAILTRFLARETGMPGAKLRVGAMTIREVLDCCTVEPVKPGDGATAPKATDPPGDSGSNETS